MLKNFTFFFRKLKLCKCEYSPTTPVKPLWTKAAKRHTVRIWWTMFYLWQVKPCYVLTTVAEGFYTPLCLLVTNGELDFTASGSWELGFKVGSISYNDIFNQFYFTMIFIVHFIIFFKIVLKTKIKFLVW